MDEKHTYRVRAGFRHGARDQYGPGDEVELTESEAAGFLDKLEEVSTSGASAPASIPEDVAPEEPRRVPGRPRKE